MLGPVVVEAGLKILYCYRTLPSPFLGPCLVCAYRCVHFLAAEILRFLILMVELAVDEVMLQAFLEEQEEALGRV